MADIDFVLHGVDTSSGTYMAWESETFAPQYVVANLQHVRDAVKKLDRFKAKHDLKVVLASDEDGAACDAWGVWVQKKLYGREYMGIERATFLVGADGNIVHAWRNVRVAGHAEAVLEALKAP